MLRGLIIIIIRLSIQTVRNLRIVPDFREGGRVMRTTIMTRMRMRMKMTVKRRRKMKTKKMMKMVKTRIIKWMDE